MKGICNIKNIALAIVVSCEFLFLVLAWIVNYFAKFKIFYNISYFLFNNNDIITSITLVVPIALFGLSVKIQKMLLQPEESNKALVQYPKYQDFKETTFVGVSYCALPIIPSIVSVVNTEEYNSYDLGYYYVVLIIVSLISLFTMYLAKYKIKEILDTYKEILLVK